jgi:excisionase family DNA binding protein
MTERPSTPGAAFVEVGGRNGFVIPPEMLHSLAGIVRMWCGGMRNTTANLGRYEALVDDLERAATANTLGVLLAPCRSSGGSGPAPRMLTVRATADHLGVSRQRVHELANAGRFPGAEQDAGGTWLIPSDDVETYAATRAATRRSAS